LSIAVELTGLSDCGVDELVRATNAASLKSGGKGKNVPVSAEMVVAEEYVEGL